MGCLLTAATLSAALGTAAAHGALSFPRPRNAVDGELPKWSNWAYPCDEAHQGRQCEITFCENGRQCQGSCPVTARSGVAGELDAANGQACSFAVRIFFDVHDSLTSTLRRARVAEPRINSHAGYWFSNGCTVGCDECDGSSNHVGHGDQGFTH